MKKYIISFLVAVLSVGCFSSCLTSGIDDYEESFDGADITGLQGLYYRYYDEAGNVKQVGVPRASEIDTEEQVMDIYYLPPSNLPAAEAAKFSTKAIVVVLNISTASVINPLGDSPKLGVPGDWSKPNQYEITAANGTKKIWTVNLLLYED